ncbi:TonB-linked SusC/RagA family outer membrane protein [Pedobacter sp. CAN_A7]|uniref:SusC/RagA family TonB-linked outer membrane protein n=1 Tax=Pedobacter sp. CAN_A7 TaxID=2787722 RepID=UPI0018CBB70A
MRKFLLSFILWLTAIGWSYGQTRPISGTVTDSGTSPLDAVTVNVVGTQKSTVTDQKGQFSIEAATGQTLKFFYMGAEPGIFVITADTKIVNIKLDISVNKLNEVVVTGYQTERKKDITGAVNVVDVAEIKDIPTGNPIKSLQGRVPGVLITTDGSPTGGATVRIRGIGTLGNNDPLYVIDGVPTKSGLEQLNQNDIESIQVLKDASSATIYGSRAANGVIIITTKKAKNGYSKIDVNASTSIQNYATKLNTLNAEERGRAYWQGAVNDRANPNNNQIYQYDWNNDFTNPVLNSVILPEFIDAAQTMRPADTYWFDEISQNSIIQSYDISMSNGGEKGNSLFSLGYYDNKGIVKESHSQKYTARFNADYSFLNNKLKIGENFSGSYIKNALIPASDVLFASLVQQPIVPVYTVDGGWGGPASGMTDRQNPVRLIEDNIQNQFHFFRLFGNAYADYEIIPKLNFRTSFGIDYNGTYQRLLKKSYTSGFLADPANQVSNNQVYQGNVIWQNTLNYKVSQGKHSGEVLLGQEYVRNINQEFSASRQGLALENINYAYLNAGTTNTLNGGSGAAYSLLSYFAKVNYVYADKYIASVTLRRDGSSRFGKENRYGTFPAFSLGWRMSEEQFIKDLGFISDLKLRYGWGKSGNQDIPNNASRSLYSAIYGTDPTWDFDRGGAYDIGGAGSGQLASGFTMIQQGNDALKWESLQESNFGLDFGLFNNKITGSVDYFIKNTDDILISPAFLAVLGDGGNSYRNGASLQNKGLDAIVNYDGKIGNDFSFNVGANFSLYRNKVTYLPNDVLASYPGNGTDKTILGRPINSYFGYIADGLFNSQEEVDGSAAQPGKGLGRIKYRDLNNDDVINDLDRDYIGHNSPKYSAGLNVSLSYKNFDMSFFIQAINVDVVNDFKTYTDFSSLWTGTNWGSRTLDAWSPSNMSSSIPALTLVDRNNEGRFSTYFIENGSYVKLRNLQIGYNLKNALKLNIPNARIFVQGSNLFTIKSKGFTGPDPEIPNYGFPVPVIGTVGVNITL